MRIAKAFLRGVIIMRWSSRNIVGATTMAVGALLLTSCGSSGSSTSSTLGSNSSASSSGKPLLGYSQPFTDPFQAAEQKGAMADYKKLGYPYLPATNANRHASNQITDVETLINEGAKGLMISVDNAKAIVPAIQFANAKNVPIVAIDLAPTGGHVAMIVRTNNVHLGQKACEQMGKLVKPGQSILSLDGDPVTANGRDRTSGFDSCMQTKFPSIKVLHVATKWNPAIAANGIQATFIHDPSLAGIYVQSDAVFFPTILDTLKQLGKLIPAGQPGHIALVGIDGTPLSLGAIRKGYEDASISQPLLGYVKYGMNYLIQAINGKKFTVGKTDHNSTIGTYHGNLADYLPSTIVTSSNVNDQSLWGNAPFAVSSFAGASS